jgi:hypothetical protein
LPRLPVACALDLLAQYGQASSVEGERQAAEQRAERERQAEQRPQQLRQAQASAVPPRRASAESAITMPTKISRRRP